MARTDSPIRISPSAWSSPAQSHQHFFFSSAQSGGERRSLSGPLWHHVCRCHGVFESPVIDAAAIYCMKQTSDPTDGGTVAGEFKCIFLGKEMHFYKSIHPFTSSVWKPKPSCVVNAGWEREISKLPVCHGCWTNYFSYSAFFFFTLQLCLTQSWLREAYHWPKNINKITRA